MSDLLVHDIHRLVVINREKQMFSTKRNSLIMRVSTASFSDPLFDESQRLCLAPPLYCVEHVERCVHVGLCPT